MIFKTYSLGELVTIKYGKNQKKVLSENGTFPIYGTGGLIGFATKSLYDKPSVLIGRKGTIEKIRYVNHPFWTVDTLFYTIVNDNIVIPQFLYYAMLQLDLLQYNEGTTIPSLRTETLNRIELRIPNIDNQKRILHFLATIDEKIVLNTKINENLEQQAVALYQNALEINSDSLVYTTIGEICDVKGGKRLPKGINLITKRNSHPYIRVRDLNNSTVLALNNDFEYVDSETQKSISRYIVSTSDVIISIVGTIGLSAIIHESLNNANLTENCVKITNSNLASPEFILLFLKSDIGQNEIIKGTVGAVQLKLPIKNIQAIRIRLLPEEEMNKLDKLIKPIFRQISSKVEENQRLSDLRDALLPKLMSGEIDVSKVRI